MTADNLNQDSGRFKFFKRPRKLGLYEIVRSQEFNQGLDKTGRRERSQRTLKNFSFI